SRKSENDIVALGDKVCADAPGAQGLLISCGGLRTLNVAEPLEARHGIPVVASTQAAFWAAMRLAGDSGHLPGHRRLRAQAHDAQAPDAQARGARAATAEARPATARH